MQYVNDDMDDLVRRAAENYPLSTGGADWSKVAAALQNTDASINDTESNKSNRRLLWLLLLLPLGLICNQLYTPVVEVDNGSAYRWEKIKDGAEKNQATLNTAAINPATPTNHLLNHVTNNQEQINISRKGGQAILEKGIVKQNSVFSFPQKNSFTAAKNQQAAKNANYSSSISQGQDNSSLLQNGFADEAGPLSRKYISQIRWDKTHQYQIAIDRPLTAVENPSKKKKTSSSQNSKGFYFGLMGSLDFTTVKFQKFEQKGLTLGILAGYQLNTNWSIETGIYKENKYYYSEGKYFNTSKIPMYGNSKITEVSGECNMYEVPVNVKYNFSSGKKTWFVAGGSSSYIMQKEDYTYSYYYGVYGPYSKRSQYLNSSRNLFATANISGGYIRKIGNGTNLRIEPYIKLPVSGMGIGKLPLLSTGLTVGITKKF